MSEKGNNRAKFYQLALFPMNNGATNVYFVLSYKYVDTFSVGSAPFVHRDFRGRLLHNMAQRRHKHKACKQKDQ